MWLALFPEDNRKLLTGYRKSFRMSILLKDDCRFLGHISRQEQYSFPRTIIILFKLNLIMDFDSNFLRQFQMLILILSKKWEGKEKKDTIKSTNF